jgi:hypothetical protein
MGGGGGDRNVGKNHKVKDDSWCPLARCWLLPGGHKEMSSILADQYSALVYEPKCGGWGGGGVCGVSANKYSCTHGAQISFGDLIPYLNYG